MRIPVSKLLRWQPKNIFLFKYYEEDCHDLVLVSMLFRNKILICKVSDKHSCAHVLTWLQTACTALFTWAKSAWNCTCNLPSHQVSRGFAGSAAGYELPSWTHLAYFFILGYPYFSCADTILIVSTKVIRAINKIFEQRCRKWPFKRLTVASLRVGHSCCVASLLLSFWSGSPSTKKPVQSPKFFFFLSCHSFHHLRRGNSVVKGLPH